MQGQLALAYLAGIILLMTAPKPRTVAAFAMRQRTKALDDAAVTDLQEAIVDDLDSGVQQKELATITGYSRENLRLIAKAVRDRRAVEQSQAHDPAEPSGEAP